MVQKGAPMYRLSSMNDELDYKCVFEAYVGKITSKRL